MFVRAGMRMFPDTLGSQSGFIQYNISMPVTNNLHRIADSDTP